MIHHLIISLAIWFLPAPDSYLFRALERPIRYYATREAVMKAIIRDPRNQWDIYRYRFIGRPELGARCRKYLRDISKCSWCNGTGQCTRYLKWDDTIEGQYKSCKSCGVAWYVHESQWAAKNGMHFQCGVCDGSGKSDF